MSKIEYFHPGKPLLLILKKHPSTMEWVTISKDTPADPNVGIPLTTCDKCKHFTGCVITTTATKTRFLFKTTGVIGFTIFAVSDVGVRASDTIIYLGDMLKSH